MGVPGVSGYERVVSSSTANPADTQRFGSVACPAGESRLAAE